MVSFKGTAGFIPSFPTEHQPVDDLLTYSALVTPVVFVVFCPFVVLQVRTCLRLTVETTFSAPQVRGGKSASQSKLGKWSGGTLPILFLSSNSLFRFFSDHWCGLDILK